VTTSGPGPHAAPNVLPLDAQPPDTVRGVDESFAAAPPVALPTDESTLRPPQPRWLALFEAVLVCGIPTQAFVAAALLVVAGMSPRDDDGLSLRFFATLSLIDTVIVLVLIRFFLRSSGERPRDVLIGQRPVWREASLGLALVPVVLVVVATVVLSLRAWFPWMQTVPTNPFLGFMDTPLEAAVFVVVVVLAGGVREELQRAFILHRFEQRLGGIRLGLVLFTIAFGALHVDQGVDVAVAVGLLGLIWGIIYIRRRSAVLPIVNHAGFNALQVFQGLIVRSFGG
jgi:membrane protease YdiL (CAAX protease family)